MRAYEVLLNDVPVGLLAEDPTGRIGFQFSREDSAQGPRPVLSQSLEGGYERTWWGRRPGQLPAFFANLLPEGRLRELLEESLGVREGDHLGLLAAVGRDLPGALSLRASPGEAALASPPEEPAHGNGGDRPEPAGLRFSLAGVQLKFSMLRGSGRFTLPAHDQRGDWIVKIGSPEYPFLAENEHAMLEWARLAGFEVPESLLLGAEELSAIRKYIPEGTRSLALRRYDRQGTLRYHQEDFAQVVGSTPEHKYDFTYDQLVVITQAIVGEQGYEELLRRLAFVVATGNNDAHLKNWALLYRDRVTPSLAPLYDQVCTIAWQALDRELALKFCGSRDFGRVSADSFRRLAHKARADPERAVMLARETVARLRDTWTRLQAETALPAEHAQALREHWERVPLLREVGDLPTK